MAKAPKPSQAYRGNGKHAWEPVAQGSARLRVPGGWLYTAFVDKPNSFATVFVPLPENLLKSSTFYI